MEKTLIVANWKEHKTVGETKEWLEKFSVSSFRFSDEIEVVICPSFVLLPLMAHEISKLDGVRLGSQDVSKFEEGQYTGEVSAKQLTDFVSYVIVGHSERRRYFGETDEDTRLKIEQCLKHGLTPLVCVSDLKQLLVYRDVNTSTTVFVYEPLEAISTEGRFHPVDPAHANAIAKKIKAAVGQKTKVLYGGSVNPENAKNFIGQPDIAGVLVGQASLDAKEFLKIVNCCNN